MDAATRASLTEAVSREVGLSREEPESFVDAVIEEMTGALAAGEKVAILNFGSFVTPVKCARMAPTRRPGSRRSCRRAA